MSDHSYNDENYVSYLSNENREAEIELFKDELDKFSDAAFPLHIKKQSGINPNLFYEYDIKGLAKREYFAGVALQGFISTLGNSLITNKELAQQVEDHITSESSKYADALIKKLNEQED